MGSDHTNNGITCLFNRLGRRIKRAPGLRAAVFAAAATILFAPAAPAGEPFEMPDPVASGTGYSRMIAGLQQRFPEAADGTKIILMDEDWFNLNQAMAEAVADLNKPPAANDDEEEYDLYDTDVTGEYVAADLMKRFTEARIGNGAGKVSAFRFYTLIGKAGKEHGTTMMSRQPKGGEVGLCFIFPHRSNLDAEYQTRLLIGLDPMRHGQLAYLPLRGGFNRELSNKYSDYHEIGHCLDQWFSPETEKTPFSREPEKYLLNRHRAEMFGDVFAALMLGKEGYTNLAARRADDRLASAAVRGAILAERNYKGDRFHFSGYMYALHDGLRAIQREIDRMTPKQLKNMSVEDAVQLSYRVTMENSLDIEVGMAANMYVMEHRFDISGLKAERHSSRLAMRRYEHAKQFVADMEQALRNVLDVSSVKGPLLAGVLDLVENPPPLPVKKHTGPHKRYMRTDELAAQLLINAGGEHATQQSLVASINAFKDAQRDILVTGTPKQSRRAMVNLGMMRDAMKPAFMAVFSGQVGQYIAAHKPAPETRPDYKPPRQPRPGV